MSYSLSIVCFLLTYIYIKLFMGKDDEEAKKPDRNSKRQRRLAL